MLALARQRRAFALREEEAFHDTMRDVLEDLRRRTCIPKHRSTLRSDGAPSTKTRTRFI